MTDGAIRSLDDIWPLQAALNRKAGIDTQALGEALLRALEAGGGRADAATRVKVGRGMKNHIDALADECHEIQQCLSWKHWYREAKEGRQYELQDVQNARVEEIGRAHV